MIIFLLLIILKTWNIYLHLSLRNRFHSQTSYSYLCAKLYFLRKRSASVKYVTGTYVSIGRNELFCSLFPLTSNLFKIIKRYLFYIEFGVIRFRPIMFDKISIKLIFLEKKFPIIQ